MTGVRMRILLGGWLALVATLAMASDLGEARALVEKQRYADAIEIFDRLIGKDPRNADLLIEAARVNGWADRNAEAARLYQRVMTVAPARVPDVRRALAWQLRWSGQCAEAMPLFDEESRKFRNDADPRHGRAECALALDRADEALAEYSQLLARDTNDLRAAKGRVRALNRLGRIQEARAAIAELVARHPDDHELIADRARLANRAGKHHAAARDLASLPETATNAALALEYARALFWAGADEAALQVLSPFEGADAAALRHTIERDAGRRLSFGFEASEDSDELEIRAFTAGLRYPLQPRSYLLASTRIADVEQLGVERDGETYLLGYGHLFGNPGAGLGALRLSAEGGARRYDPWSSGAWRLRGAWLRSDVWRFDAEAGNEIVENIQSLANHVRFNYASVGFDARPFDRWLFSAGALAAEFRDGNRRSRLHGRIEYRLHDAARLYTGVEAFGFNDSDPPNPSLGYYSPERYREGKMYLLWRPEAFGFGFRLKGAIGRLSETPGDASTIYAWEAGAARNLGERFRLDAYVGRSDSASLTSGPGGYRRNYLGGQLHWWF
jgi:thioredoxin-like negative regulator of GroEL